MRKLLLVGLIISALASGGQARSHSSSLPHHSYKPYKIQTAPRMSTKVSVPKIPKRPINWGL